MLPTTLQDALTAHLGDRFSTARAVCEQHGRDESPYPALPPDAVVWPLTTEEVAAIVRLCSEHGVPLIPYGVPGSASVADAVAATIQQAERPIRAVMLERLGPTVWHTNPSSAMALLEELEETARLWLLSERRPTPLTDTQINDLRAQFNAPW